jgi:hypothetical protein
MLVRDVDGRLVIVGRNGCKNELVYNEKIYNIRKDYTRKYKSILYYTNSIYIPCC